MDEYASPAGEASFTPPAGLAVYESIFELSVILKDIFCPAGRASFFGSAQKRSKKGRWIDDPHWKDAVNPYQSDRLHLRQRLCFLEQPDGVTASLFTETKAASPVERLLRLTFRRCSYWPLFEDLKNSKTSQKETLLIIGLNQPLVSGGLETAWLDQILGAKHWGGDVLKRGFFSCLFLPQQKKTPRREGIKKMEEHQRRLFLDVESEGNFTLLKTKTSNVKPLEHPET